MAYDRLARLKELSSQIESEWRHVLETTERVSALIDTNEAAIVSATLDGAIVSWNPAATALLGWGEEEALDMPLTVIVPELYRPMHLAGFAQYKKIGTLSSDVLGHWRSLSALHKDGHEIPVEIMVSGFQTASGRFVSAIMRSKPHVSK